MTAPGPPPEAVLDLVLDVTRALARETGGTRAERAVSPEASLEREVGLGSLERVELVARLERASGLALDDRCLALDTAAGLARALVDGAPGTRLSLPAPETALDAARRHRRRREHAARIALAPRAPRPRPRPRLPAGRPRVAHAGRGQRACDAGRSAGLGRRRGGGHLRPAPRRGGGRRGRAARARRRARGHRRPDAADGPRLPAHVLRHPARARDPGAHLPPRPPRPSRGVRLPAVRHPRRRRGAPARDDPASTARGRLLRPAVRDARRRGDRRRARRLGRAGLRPGGRRRRPGLHPVHLGQHRPAQGRPAHARQPARQRPRDRRRARDAPHRRRGELAAPVPRHGAHRLLAHLPPPGPAADAPVSHRVPRAPRAVAVGHPPAAGDAVRRAELRLRAVRAAHPRRGARGARSLLVARGPERSGARQPGHARALHAPLLALRLPARGDDAGLRPRRVLGRALAAPRGPRSEGGPRRARSLPDGGAGGGRGPGRRHRPRVRLGRGASCRSTRSASSTTPARRSPSGRSAGSCSADPR